MAAPFFRVRKSPPLACLEIMLLRPYQLRLNVARHHNVTANAKIAPELRSLPPNRRVKMALGLHRAVTFPAGWGAPPTGRDARLWLAEAAPGLPAGGCGREKVAVSIRATFLLRRVVVAASLGWPPWPDQAPDGRDDGGCSGSGSVQCGRLRRSRRLDRAGEWRPRSRDGSRPAGRSQPGS